jgi:hypothetical protein
MMFAKILTLLTFFDDTFDSYGTMDEVRQFSQTVQRYVSSFLLSLRALLVCELKLLGPLLRSIRSIKRRLFTKIITRMDRKLRDESISLINLSFEIVYCSTPLSNHDIIRLVRFVSKSKVGVVEWVLSLIYI